jgi:hypothetical protein
MQNGLNLLGSKKKLMKRTFIQLIIGSAAGMIILAGCSKSFITKTPADSISAGDALANASVLQTALLGAYSELRSLGVAGRDLPVIGDLMADNTYLETHNSGRYLPQFNYSVTVNDGTALDVWQDCYATILRVNQILDSKLTGSTVDQIKGQAYAIRALCYFKLVNYFATPFTQDTAALGVPIVLHYVETALPKRNTVGTVYNQIVSDLKAGIPLAPAYSKSVILSTYAIKGLLARTYLYMGDNADAESTAVDVINNGGFSLVAPGNLTTFWGNPAAQTDATEVMFEVDADVLNNNGTDDLAAIYYLGYQDIYCSSDLYNLYSATDARRSLIMPGNNKSGVPSFIVVKFPNANSADRDNLKVIRLAEVYLIAAEAALPGGETTAKTYLNALLAMRDPTAAPYASTGAQLLSDIVTERRKELAFEGDRFFDLNRLHLAINRVANNGSIPAGPGNVNLTIPYPDSRRVAPIPQAETVANPNIATQQNPGY